MLGYMTLEADLLMKNCAILPMTKVGTIDKGCIAVRNGDICYVGRVATQRGPDQLWECSSLLEQGCVENGDNWGCLSVRTAEEREYVRSR
jgi:hypothetical protein